jgi:hypothetical protein
MRKRIDGLEVPLEQRFSLHLGRQLRGPNVNTRLRGDGATKQQIQRRRQRRHLLSRQQRRRLRGSLARNRRRSGVVLSEKLAQLHVMSQ